MAPRTWRLFIAHPVPERQRETLHTLLAPYRAAFPHARWTSPTTWHLTLLFLGSVQPQRIGQCEALTDGVAHQTVPYRVLADRGDGRIRPGSGAAWLGLTTGARELIAAATLAAQSCPPGITGGAPPKRTPSAHLTVARKADAQVVEALRTQALGSLSVGWTVDQLQLVRSHLEPDGARYETLHQATM